MFIASSNETKAFSLFRLDKKHFLQNRNFHWKTTDVLSIETNTERHKWFSIVSFSSTVSFPDTVPVPLFYRKKYASFLRYFYGDMYTRYKTYRIFFGLNILRAAVMDTRKSGAGCQHLYVSFRRPSFAQFTDGF